MIGLLRHSSGHAAHTQTALASRKATIVRVGDTPWSFPVRKSRHVHRLLLGQGATDAATPLPVGQARPVPRRRAGPSPRLALDPGGSRPRLTGLSV